MRLAVFSDVHGNWWALEAVLQALEGQVDVAVCAGDLLWGGPCPERVIERLQAAGLPCVVGNTDLMLVREDDESRHPWARWARARLDEHHLAFLRALPLQHRVETPAGTVLVVHSTPEDPARHLPHWSEEAALERLYGAADAALVVHGHDHWPSVVPLRRLTVVGTGAVGLPYDGDPRACFVLITVRDGELKVEHRRVAYDVGAAAEEARQLGMPGAARWGAAIRQGLPPDRVIL